MVIRCTIVLCAVMLMLASSAMALDRDSSWSRGMPGGAWDMEQGVSQLYQWAIDVTGEEWYQYGVAHPGLQIRSATLTVLSWDNIDDDPRNMMFVDLLDSWRDNINGQPAVGGDWIRYSDYYCPLYGYPELQDEFQSAVNEYSLPSPQSDHIRAWWDNAFQLAQVEDYANGTPETWSYTFTPAAVAALNSYLWSGTTPGKFGIGYDVDCEVGSDEMILNLDTTPELSSGALLLCGMLPVGFAWWRRRKTV